MQSSIEIMRKIVYAFYDDDFSFGSLARRGEHLRASLTDCLIGNVDDQDFRVVRCLSTLPIFPNRLSTGAPSLRVKLAFLTPARAIIWRLHARQFIAKQLMAIGHKDYASDLSSSFSR